MPEEVVTTVAAGKKTPDWWKIGDGVVLLVYTGIVLWTIQYHEKWADEAQAWLIARDLSLKSIWFHELRYEGSPGLWHTILWVAQHVFHARYDAISYIGLCFAVASAAIVLFVTPFPKPVRWLMLFSFFLIYQYAVIARPYVLFACFTFLAARQFRDRERPDLFALSIAPLACLTAHGSVLGACLATVYAAEFLRHWHDHAPAVRRRFVFACSATLVLYICLFLVLVPPADVEAVNGVPLTVSLALQRAIKGISGALVDNRWLSGFSLVIFAVWCYFRKSLWAFLLPVIGVTGLYVYADGWAHQQGTIFLAMMAGLAIAWPPATQQGSKSSNERLAYVGIVGLLVAILCYQTYAAASVIKRDVRLPYSGASDAAEFLRPIVKKGTTVYGYQYGMVAISAYFDHKIFANLNTSYYHHVWRTFNQNDIEREVIAGKPEYLVFQWWQQWDPRLYTASLGTIMQNMGYTFVHASDGFLFTKTGYSNRQIYLIFQRNTSVDASDGK